MNRRPTFAEEHQLEDPSQAYGEEPLENDAWIARCVVELLVLGLIILALAIIGAFTVVGWIAEVVS